ncbi:MAG TPA: tRNA (adenosine(37)-N6)-threonylcarbamoyltransferase complex ATPase subunit type 1 TsaE, partial [Solirubrobacteraceae bacterium]|nr:tRNA (adenosine(37)-N6)-threonylcarbamoyltransferase complex ATPase subunit type 1 TsaE [Solirubrobacteraceae bacterium]
MPAAEPPLRIETAGAEATAAFAGQLAAGLAAGDVVLVEGQLGAGKTTFVRGACRALGVEGPITSPTFALANRYRAAGGLIVSHLDLYRLGGLESEDPDLLADYLGPDRLAFVEWPRGARAELGPVRL